MVVVRHFVAAVTGNDIQVVMSAWPHLARAKQGTFKLIVRIGDAVRMEDRLQAVRSESFVVRHERYFVVSKSIATKLSIQYLAQFVVTDDFRCALTGKDQYLLPIAVDM